jgi:hypothetical protein
LLLIFKALARKRIIRAESRIIKTPNLWFNYLKP